MLVVVINGPNGFRVIKTDKELSNDVQICSAIEDEFNCKLSAVECFTVMNHLRSECPIYNWAVGSRNLYFLPEKVKLVKVEK